MPSDRCQNLQRTTYLRRTQQRVEGSLDGSLKRRFTKPSDLLNGVASILPAPGGATVSAEQWHRQPRHSKLLVNYATHIRFCQPFTYGTGWFQVQVLYGNLVTTFKRVLVK
jgi:hypothetical protein